MKNNVYIFTKTPDTFWSYPSDYTKTFLADSCNYALNRNQLLIRREGNLVYYIYLERILNKQDVLGLCFVLNSSIINRPEILFPEFRYVVMRMLYDNLLLATNDINRISIKPEYLTNTTVESTGKCKIN
ncbi:MAG: hypothetical protein HDS66_03475 [Bacteroidales bacterium]|nr:hypothetical protein [Bacteroidales bacterium]